jgi:hypothetical protein
LTGAHGAMTLAGAAALAEVSEAQNPEAIPVADCSDSKHIFMSTSSPNWTWSMRPTARRPTCKNILRRSCVNPSRVSRCALLPRTDRYAYAAILRDYLYWDQDGTRRGTDDILLAAMKDTDVTSVTRAVIYAGIRTDGPPVCLTFGDPSRDGGTIFLRHHYRPNFAIAECFASKTRPGGRVFAPCTVKIDRKPHDG